MNRILEKEPANILALKELQILYWRLGKLKRSVQVSHQISKMVNFEYSLLPQWWFEIVGQVYALKGKKKEAREIFEKGETYFGKDSLRIWEFSLNANQENSQEVIEALQVHLDQNQSIHQKLFAWYHIGRCYERIGKLEEATQAYRNSLKVEPHYGPSRKRLLKMRLGT